jgi:hypothetical protein
VIIVVAVLVVSRSGEEPSRNLGEFAGFTDATCEAFDLTWFEETSDSEHDPEMDDFTSIDESETGGPALSCYFSTKGLAQLHITVDGGQDSTAAGLWPEWERQGLEDHPSFEVTDLEGLGDSGYRFAESEWISEYITYRIVDGGIGVQVRTGTGIDADEAEAADAMLAEYAEQALSLFASEI